MKVRKGVDPADINSTAAQTVARIRLRLAFRMSDGFMRIC